MTERRGGGLRRLRKEADGDVAELRRLLQEFPGMARPAPTSSCARPSGSGRKPRPCLDDKALSGAGRLGLPKDSDRPADLAGNTEPALLAAALVRAAVDQEVAEDSLRRAA